MTLTIAAFYRFTAFPDPASLRGPLARAAHRAGVKGAIVLAPEGINGTIAGARAGIDAMLAHLRTLPGCARLDWKESTAAAQSPSAASRSGSRPRSPPSASPAPTPAPAPAPTSPPPTGTRSSPPRTRW